MNDTKQGKQFDIHQKLKNSKHAWSYMHSAGTHQADAKYEFRTIFLDEIEHALYERYDDYFVLIDFFKSYDDACEEAKKIINAHSDLSTLFQI